jgi:hypothetical protein
LGGLSGFSGFIRLYSPNPLDLRSKNSIILYAPQLSDSLFTAWAKVAYSFLGRFNALTLRKQRRVKAI